MINSRMLRIGVIVWSVVMTSEDDMFVGFFFVKQKTAYECRLSLVGSEMCIRDRIT